MTEKPRAQVLYFYGPDCPVCKTMAPFIDEAGETYEGRVKLRKFNSAREAKVARRYGVTSVPTTIAVYEGTEVMRVVGARTPGGLRKIFEAAETGEAAESGFSPKVRILGLLAAAGLAGVTVWSGVWALGILVVLALVATFWDEIRR